MRPACAKQLLQAGVSVVHLSNLSLCIVLLSVSGLRVCVFKILEVKEIYKIIFPLAGKVLGFCNFWFVCQLV